MTDTTQGADAPNDSALFNEATNDTLEKFENPPVAPAEKPPAPPPAGDKEVKPEAKPEDNAPVPAGRLREEAEARRKAERERDELRQRLEAVQRPAPQAPQPPPKGVDLFENPQGFVQQEVKPFLEQIRTEFQSQREAMSLDFALQRHGNDKVSAARQALERGMASGDPAAWSTYNRAMASHDPYGVIIRAHQEGEALRTIGGDLDGYRKRILEEAMNDPEYRAKVIAAAKGQAAAAGNNVARPVKPSVASSPSLGNIGAGGGDQEIIEPSDNDLFRAATTAKRR
jgi:hypothetical protein